LVERYLYSWMSLLLRNSAFALVGGRAFRPSVNHSRAIPLPDFGNVSVLARRRMSVRTENTRVTVATAGRVQALGKIGDPNLPIAQRGDDFCKVDFHSPGNKDAVVSSEKRSLESYTNEGRFRTLLLGAFLSMMRSRPSARLNLPTPPISLVKRLMSSFPGRA
jgi:hypothetical protein